MTPRKHRSGPGASPMSEVLFSMWSSLCFLPISLMIFILWVLYRSLINTFDLFKYVAGGLLWILLPHSIRSAYKYTRFFIPDIPLVAKTVANCECVTDGFKETALGNVKKRSGQHGVRWNISQDRSRSANDTIDIAMESRESLLSPQCISIDIHECSTEKGKRLLVDLPESLSSDSLISHGFHRPIYSDEKLSIISRVATSDISILFD